MPPRFQCPLHHAQTDNRQRRGGAGHHDVILPQTVRKFIQTNGVSAETLRQRLSAFDGAVGDRNLFRRAGAEMRGAKLNHFARADEQDFLRGDGFKQAFRQLHGGGGHRNGIRADGGAAADFLGDGEGVLKQFVQIHAQRARRFGKAHGVFHLPQNLRFAQHHRIQPAGDTKGVSHRVSGRQGIQIRLQPRRFEMVMLRQPVSDRLRLVGYAIDFGAIAGRQNRRLMHRWLARQGD